MPGATGLLGNGLPIWYQSADVIPTGATCSATATPQTARPVQVKSLRWSRWPGRWPTPARPSQSFQRIGGRLYSRSRGLTQTPARLPHGRAGPLNKESRWHHQQGRTPTRHNTCRPAGRLQGNGQGQAAAAGVPGSNYAQPSVGGVQSVFTGQASAGVPNPPLAFDVQGENSAAFGESILTNPGYADVNATLLTPGVPIPAPSSPCPRATSCSSPRPVWRPPSSSAAAPSRRSRRQGRAAH